MAARPHHHRRLCLLAVSTLLAGCAHLAPEPGPTASRTIRGTKVVVTGPEEILGEVAEAVERALPRLADWGTLEAPVRIRVHATHDALERSVNRVGYPWLRAWARYDTMELQDPRTWSVGGSRGVHLLELLTHELTHCLMYQRVGTASNWARKRIPLWFREGMASVVSEQGYRRLGNDDLARLLRNRPGVDPLRDAESLVQSENDLVYGAAHRAFEFLLHRYGMRRVGTLLDAIGTGASFEMAFETAFGISHDAFEDEFQRFIRWEGWRAAVQSPDSLSPSSGATSPRGA